MRIRMLFLFALAVMVLISCTPVVPKEGYMVRGKLSEINLDDLPQNKIPIKYTIDYPSERTVSKCVGSTGFQTPVEIPLGLALKDAISDGLQNSFKVIQENYSYLVAIRISSVSSTHEWAGSGRRMGQASISTKIAIMILDPNGKSLSDKTQDYQESLDITNSTDSSHPAAIFDEITGRIAVKVVKSVSRTAKGLDPRAKD